MQKWKDLNRVFASFRVELSLLVTGYRDCCDCGVDVWESVDQSEDENEYTKGGESKVGGETTLKRSNGVHLVRIGGGTLGRVK